MKVLFSAHTVPKSSKIRGSRMVRKVSRRVERPEVGWHCQQERR